MGTSSSSNGPGSNVPLVPPWVPPIPVPDGSIPLPPQLVPLSPPSRFKSTRTHLTKFSTSGDKDSLRRGVGNYFKTGYGGGSTAVSRFGGTPRTAGALYSVLGGSGGSSPERDAVLAALVPGASADAVITAVIEAITPIDGSQDAEATRDALADCLAELVDKNPNVDLLNLTAPQLNALVASFVAADVFARFKLDVGKAIIEGAPTTVVGVKRLREAWEYIRETVAAEFEKLSAGSQAITKERMSQVVVSTLKDAVAVFEEYAS